MNNYDEIIPPFFSKNYEHSKEFFLNLFNITNHESKVILEKMRENCLEILNSENNDNNEYINKITHKVWLTDEECGHIPNKIMLDFLKKNYTELNDFKHYLWCNNEKIAQEILSLIDCKHLDIEFRNTKEFDYYPGRKLYNILLKNKLYANACDILRIQIIHKYGGLYSDFGWAISKNIPEYINNFDIMFNGGNAEWCKGYISHNVIYSRNQKHIIFEKMLSYLEYKNFLIKFIENKNGFYTLEIVGPRFIMAAIPGLCKNDKLIILVDNELTFSKHHNSSHQNGSFGSNTINACIEIINNEIKEYIRQ